jgi:hypothetical protein
MLWGVDLTVRRMVTRPPPKTPTLDEVAGGLESRLAGEGGLLDS